MLFLSFLFFFLFSCGPKQNETQKGSKMFLQGFPWKVQTRPQPTVQPLPLCQTFSHSFTLPCYNRKDGLCDQGRLGNLFFSLMASLLYSQKFCLKLCIPKLGLMKTFFQLKNLGYLEENPSLLKKKPHYLFEWEEIKPNFYVRDRILEDLIKPKASQAFLKGKNYQSFFFYNTRIYQPYLPLLEETFAFHPHLKKVQKFYLEALKAKSKETQLIFLHIRRGDLTKAQNEISGYFLAPLKWYLRWIKTYFPIDQPLTLYLASDSPEVIRSQLQKNLKNPCQIITAQDLLKTPPPSYQTKENPFATWTQMDQEVFLDYALLSSGNPPKGDTFIHLLSNSTFSISAAFRSQGGIFLRPNGERKKLVSFNPWKTEPIWGGSNLSFEEQFQFFISHSSR